MDLQRDERPAQVYLKGAEKKEVLAGSRLVIGARNPKDNWLNETVPEGKKWKVSVSVNVQEVDA